MKKRVSLTLYWHSKPDLEQLMEFLKNGRCLRIQEIERKGLQQLCERRLNAGILCNQGEHASTTRAGRAVGRTVWL